MDSSQGSWHWLLKG